MPHTSADKFISYTATFYKSGDGLFQAQTILSPAARPGAQPIYMPMDEGAIGFSNL